MPETKDIIPKLEIEEAQQCYLQIQRTVYQDRRV